MKDITSLTKEQLIELVKKQHDLLVKLAKENDDLLESLKEASSAMKMAAKQLEG